MEELDAETRENIRRARTLGEIPPEHYLVSFKSLGELFSLRAREDPEKAYLVFYDDDRGVREEHSYARFWDWVNRIASFMQDKLDIGVGDRVGTAMHNHSTTVAIYFAAWRLGAVVVPTNVDEDDERLSFTFANAGVKVAFVMEGYFQRVKALCHRWPQLKHLVKVGGEREVGAFSLEEEVAACSPLATPPQPALENEALLVYTSGTTGPPKGVVLTQYNLMVDPLGIAKWHSLGRESRLMCILPIHHVNGIVATLLTPLYAGGGVVLNRRFSAASFWERAAREGVHIVSVVPTILQYLVERGEDISKYDLRAFRYVICGAGTLSIQLALRFEDRFHIPIVHGYGLSETTCYDCFLPPDLPQQEHRKWLSRYGYPSIGVPIEVNEMAIHDSQGRGLGEGERGEIVIRGPLVMKGYYRRPDANRDTFKYGWFRSGDEGFYILGADGRGYFFITGRIKELINRGGVKLSPFEIEEVMQEVKGVKVALAVSFDNKWYGEEVGGYVVLEAGARVTQEDILAHCRKRLPFMKRPKVIVFGKDVPVTSTGKYQRLMLKPLFKAWEEVQFREEKG